MPATYRLEHAITFSLHHQFISDDALVGGGIFPTHFFGQKHPSFFDHFERRSDKYNIFQETTRIGLEPELILFSFS